MGGQFDTIGPIPFPGQSEDFDEKVVARWFKEVVEAKAGEGLDSAVGIYIVAKQIGSRPPVPWYVGKTEAGFLRRFKQHARIKKGFGDLRQIPKGGKLVVFLFPLRTGKKAKFQKAPKKKNSILAIKKLEEMLIRSCLIANGQLLNVSQKRLHQDISVPGYIGNAASSSSDAAISLASMFKSSPSI